MRTILSWCLLSLLALSWGSASARPRQGTAALPLPCGVVEGFYGRPWSHEDRLSIIRFLGENGFTHYCYAPKDDPYHRRKWREPYPPDLAQRLKELNEACKRARITFCFAISPGLDIEYSNPEELQKLVSKLEPLSRDGVHNFALFFDDVPSTFTHVSDIQKYGSFAEAHADLSNRLYAELRKLAPENTLIVCPTEYYHNDATPYLRELGQKLHPQIPLVWTGMGVLSQSLTAGDVLKIRATIGRKPFIWDNYPVNDWDTGHIYLGPIRNRNPLLPLTIAGYWSNPMNEAELSKIPLLTIADYFRSPETYNPEMSWRNALRRVGGARAYPYLFRLADLMTGSFLSQDEGRVLCALVGDYLESPSPATLASLREYLQQLLDLEPNLDRTLTNRRLYEELRPSLKKLRLHVKNLQIALRMSELPTTSDEAERLQAALFDGLRAEDTPTTTPEIGSNEWNRLLKDESTVFQCNVADDLFAQVQQLLHSRRVRVTSPTLPVIITAPPPFAGRFAENAVDHRQETFYQSRTKWKVGEAFAVDFGRTYASGSQLTVQIEAANAKEARLLRSLAVEVSLTGTAWQEIATNLGASSVVNSPLPFRCARIVAKTELETPLVIREFNVPENASQAGGPAQSVKH